MGFPPARHGTRPARPKRTTRRCATVLSFTAVIGSVATGAAHAADGGGTVGEDSVTAEVRDGAGTSSRSCRWRPVTGVDPQSGSVIESPVIRTVDGVRETLYQRTCRRPDGGDSWYQWVRDSTSDRMLTRARDTATQRITHLLFRTAPPAGRNVVNVGTWFWVPRAAWKPVSATAHVALPFGEFSVTVTATPSRLRFDPGDGNDPVWCDGPGRQWNPRIGDREPSDCMHTYRHSSDNRADGRYDATTSVQWNIRVSSNFGLSFPLPPVTLGLPTPVTVRELQAVMSQ